MRLQPNPVPLVRVICVPHAGGSIATFREWGERLGDADVAVVQLPGHGGRVTEPPLTAVSQAADGLANALVELPSVPIVLFGHDLGALVAFETARRLRDRRSPPLALFVSGHRGPTLPAPLGPISGLPADEFMAAVRHRHDGIPDPGAVDPDQQRATLPALRADVAMLESYRYTPAAPLPCPIFACGGSADLNTSRDELEAWRPETSGRFSTHLFSGGHAYVHYEHVALTTLIAHRLTVLLSALARPTAG